MSNSLTFDNTDLSAYGLSVLTSGPSLGIVFEADVIQLPDLALAAQSTKMPKPIALDVVVQGSSRAVLLGYLDSIRKVIVEREAKALILDTQPDRYWLARFVEMDGYFMSPLAYAGTISFAADDPAAYGIDPEEDTGLLAITPDPDTEAIVVGGTAYVNPVYTLTAGELLTDVTIKLENVTTVEELQWTGTMANGKALVIDVATWLVTYDGAASMATVTGKFPRLQPGVSNNIKVTNFSDSGTLRVVYRNRYL